MSEGKRDDSSSSYWGWQGREVHVVSLLINICVSVQGVEAEGGEM